MNLKGLETSQKEALFELVMGDSWPVLLRVIDGLAANIDGRVLKYNLREGADGLVQEKARSEGARTLQTAISKLKDEFKKVQ